MVAEKIQGLVMSIVLMLLLLGLSVYIILMLYPFYVWEVPFKVVGKKTYNPGEHVQLSTHRTSKINTRVDAFRELVRVSGNHMEHEVEKVRYTVGFDKGEKDVSFYFQIPEHCEIIKNGMYRYTGTATYKVFGLVERTIPFRSETFRIVGCSEAPDDEAADEFDGNQMGPAKKAE